jgi:lipopolysaccharide export system ATP-binding protein
VPDLFSYFRRRDRGVKRTSRRQSAGALAGDHEAIDLASMGGAISTIYLDIASVSAPAPKARGEVPPPPLPPRAVPQPPFTPPQISPPPPPVPSRPQRPPPAQNGPRKEPRNESRNEPRNELRNESRTEPAAIARPRRRADGNGAAPSDRKGLLAVHNVEKTFVGNKVVKGVSLYVRKGEAVGLLGPNGAGKTTVFYMITGLIKADRGRVELDGCDVTKLPMYQRARLGIGYLPQEASIFRGLTVEENIRAVLEVVEPNPRRREQDLDALLEEFNIARLRKTPAIALSGGERRRVEIARSLATRPNYMLLDEPFAGIDPIAVGDIQALVRHLTNRGIGVLITDHNVRETLGLTDRAYIIYSGEVLMEGRADAIVNDPDVRRLYLGEEFRL